MLLNKLFMNTNIIIQNNIEINNIETNSKNISKGDLFIAIKGITLDGHNYVKEAIKNGAKAVLINEDRLDDFIDLNIDIYTCKDTRKVLGIICSNYYDNPSKKFSLIGITGTKGKTTTSFMIKNIFEMAGYNVGLIGTNGTYINNKKIYDNDRTTPDSLLLQKLFYEMVLNKCDFVIMEVSSQSLKMDRVIGSDFDVSIFTNFSKDHISKNEHESLDDYFLSKTKLFDMSPISIINIDDEKSKTLMDLKKNTKYITYSVSNNSNKKANNIKYSNIIVSYETIINKKIEKVIVNIPGLFNVYNSLCAITVSEYFNIDTKYILKGLYDTKVKGRNEYVENDLGLNIIIDYAHTEKSMENILVATNEYKKGILITVFGCGGDRDKGKRKKMGEISGKLSDFTIITSDNPRSENPSSIISEIEEGISPVTSNYLVLESRIEAIKKAISMANKDDIILLLGKGHELYQEINGEKYPFDERLIIKKIISKEI